MDYFRSHVARQQPFALLCLREFDELLQIIAVRLYRHPAPRIPETLHVIPGSRTGGV